MKKFSVQINRQLNRFTRNRGALSAVVTTLIILVISVLLAGVVTYFSINVTSTRVQEESLVPTRQHAWYDSETSVAQAAFMIMNTGGRDTVISKITVRGQTCVWSKVYYAVASNSIPKDLPYIATLNDEDPNTIDGVDYTFTQAIADLTLQSGKTLIVYLSNPDSISVNDVGLTVSINIFTSQAMYYKETNVQGTGGAAVLNDPGSDEDGELEITNVYASADNDQNLVLFAVTNVGSSPVVITKDDLIVRGVQVSSVSFAYAPIDAEYIDDAIFVESYTILPGKETLLLFFDDTSWYIQPDDVGNNIIVGLNLGGGHSVTTHTTIQPA